MKDYTHLCRIASLEYKKLGFRGRARLYASQKNPEKCIDDLTSMIKLDSTDEDAYMERGIAKLNRDVRSQIEDTIQTLKEDEIEEFRKYYKEDFITEQLNDTKGAISDFSVGLSINPANAKIYRYRARAYESLNMFSEALEDMNRAIEIDPSSKNFEFRGLIYMEIEEFQLSLQDYDKAISLDPENWLAYANRAILKRFHLKDIAGAEMDEAICEKHGLKGSKTYRTIISSDEY